MEEINYKHRRIMIIFSQELASQKEKIFRSIFAYLEQHELLEMISKLNYDSNTAGSFNSFQIDCHPEVVLAIKNFIKTNPAMPGLNLAHYPEAGMDDF